MKLKNFSAYRLYDERTGNTLLGIEYPKNLGGRGMALVDSDDAETPERVRKALKKKGAALTGTKASQIKIVEGMLAALETTTRRLAMKPGFRDAGFVLGPNMIGSAQDVFVWPDGQDKPDIGHYAGTLDSWKANVAPIVEQSSFAAVAVLSALAAPLVTYVHNRIKETAGLGPLLAETFVLNFSGDSGVGKTSNAKVAAGISGSPDSVFPWNFSRAGLEAAAESRNDLLLVLDDTEKHVEIEMPLKSALQLVGQFVPMGASKALSPAARDNGSPERRWTTIGLTTSPIPLDVIADNCRWTRSDGEKVRFINIALPTRDNGGIFDRLPEDCPDAVTAGKQLIAELELKVQLHYGQVMPAWLTILLAENHALKIQKYQKHFVAKLAGDGTGYDARYAAKFGVLYAAGRLAVEAGLLPWPKSLPWKVVRKCYNLALKSAAPPADRAVTKLKRLNQLCNQKARFPVMATTGTRTVKYGADTLGVVTTYKGKTICAIRDKELRKLAGSKTVAREMLKKLKAAGALGSGQGSAGTSQPGINAKIGGKVTKPRYWVIARDKIAKAAKK